MRKGSPVRRGGLFVCVQVQIGRSVQSCYSRGGDGAEAGILLLRSWAARDLGGFCGICRWPNTGCGSADFTLTSCLPSSFVPPAACRTWCLATPSARRAHAEDTARQQVAATPELSRRVSRRYHVPQLQPPPSRCKPPALAQKRQRRRRRMRRRRLCRHLNPWDRRQQCRRLAPDSAAGVVGGGGAGGGCGIGGGGSASPPALDAIAAENSAVGEVVNKAMEREREKEREEEAKRWRGRGRCWRRRSFEKRSEWRCYRRCRGCSGGCDGFPGEACPGRSR